MQISDYKHVYMYTLLIKCAGRGESQLPVRGKRFFLTAITYSMDIAGLKFDVG